LIQKIKNTPPELISISDIPRGNYFWIGDINDFTNGTISIQSTLLYENVCRNLQIENPIQRIEPLYIKKPNIT
jgi:hypothetical protein